MGLTLAQLFVRNVDLKKFSRSVGPIWRELVASDTQNPLRQLVILITDTPWLGLIDSTNNVPRELAARISEEAGGEAFWVSIDSVMLRHSMLKVIEGEPVIDRTIPRSEKEGRMPWYTDPETEAWNAMKALRIPPAYRMLRIREIHIEEPGEDEKADLVILERPSLEAPLQHGLLRHEIRQPREEDSGPPTEYSVYNKDEKALSDLYLVSGGLQDERVDNLLSVIDGIARRKFRPPDHEYFPIITVVGDEEQEQKQARAFIQDRFRHVNLERPLAFRM